MAPRLRACSVGENRRTSAKAATHSSPRRTSTASIDATKFPPGLVPGEVPRAPRVTFDEHLFFSQDELDKVRVPTKGAFDSLKDLAENAPRAGPKTSGTETDASSS